MSLFIILSLSLIPSLFSFSSSSFTTSSTRKLSSNVVVNNSNNNNNNKYNRRKNFSLWRQPSLITDNEWRNTDGVISNRGVTLKATPTTEETTETTTTPATAEIAEIFESTTGTTQDDTVDAPASMVFYDDVIESEGVVCARGVCVLSYDDDDDEFAMTTIGEGEGKKSIIDKVLSSYIGPRALLAFASILYGTNFPLGAIMNDNLPPSAATSARMVLASIALSPFIFKLNPSLSKSALLCGCFTAMGYITQSLSLVDTSPATVAFLGAVTVIVCPTLEFIINKKPMSISDAPQTWLAASLCLVGVGILELYDPVSNSFYLEQVGFGDALAILQAVGFGTSFFLTERMMRGQPDQALPITAVQVFTTAFLCMVWCILDGWININDPTSMQYSLPNMFFEPSLQLAAVAVVWTGIITTAINRFIETSALGKMSSAEASIILATEPLWAALFAALLLKEDFGANDYIGGILIVLACLANTLKPTDFDFIFNNNDNNKVKE